jgi:Uma2 family endonuclease
MPPLDKKADKKYTYQEYLNWPDDERWEIINGDAYNMSPSPVRKHQAISRNITWQIGLQKDKLKSCSFFEAPMDVVFDEYNIVQPDIFIVCDKNKKTDYIFEIPALIIEIVSPSTELKDKREKFHLYERFGVKEYIIIYPEREYIERYILKRGKYGAPEIFNWDETLNMKTFDLEISLWEVFDKDISSEDYGNI